MLNHEKQFFLKGNGAFNDRQKSVFGALDILTPENTKIRYSNDEFKNAAAKRTVDGVKKEMKQFRGQESIFKRPDVPLKRSFKMPIPDFVKNPHKWKKYKMSDDVMSDKSNTVAAMSFLKEMKDRHEPMESDCVSGPIIFNKHISEEGQRLAIEEKSKSTFLNSKTIMPEYVVGQKVKKSVTFKKQVQIDEPSSSVRLSHLHCFDDE